MWKQGRSSQTKDYPCSVETRSLYWGKVITTKLILGKYENATQLEKEVQRDASKEYIRRLSVIWSSSLSFTRKVNATNSFATSVLLYHMWTADWPIEHLRELDRSTRQIMNDNKAKHKHESTSLLYLPVGKGGKGMQELETLYKTKIKTVHYLTVSADPHIQLVSTFQNVFTNCTKMLCKSPWEVRLV